MNVHDIGDEVILTSELFDSDSQVFVDPSEMHLAIRDPLGVITQRDWPPDGDIEKMSTGHFRSKVYPDSAGDWGYRWWSVNKNASEEKFFRVRQRTVQTSDSTKTLRFVAVQDGELLTLGSAPRLSNPSAQFGVIRLDTRAIVVADNVAFSGSGDYSYEFAEPETGLRYRYYVEATHDDVTYYLSRTTDYMDSCALVIGRYCTSHLVETQYGVENVHKWLAIDDHDEAVDYAMRFYNAIREAEQELDDLLRDGPYSLPFSAPVPTQIASLAATLAGIKAYEARGVHDSDPETGKPFHRLQYKLKQAYRQISAIKSGDARLDVTHAVAYPVVSEEDDSTSADVMSLWQL